MTAHGTERNRREEATYGRTVTMQAPGATVTLPSSSLTQTVSERWCAPCGAWATAKGILGGLMCPTCRTGWDEA